LKKRKKTKKGNTTTTTTSEGEDMVFISRALIVFKIVIF